MPNVWKDPDVVLEHKGVTIYHVYRNDQVDEGPRTYWYGYTPSCDDCGTDSFDIRDVARVIGIEVDADNHEEILIKAIDLGHITTENGFLFKDAEEAGE
jgi:hypothetical protein